MPVANQVYHRRVDSLRHPFQSQARYQLLVNNELSDPHACEHLGMQIRAISEEGGIGGPLRFAAINRGARRMRSQEA